MNNPSNIPLTLYLLIVILKDNIKKGNIKWY